MSLIPTIYSSTDPGAPTISGQSGSLVALLDAILVNGYGSGPTAKAPAGWTIEHTTTNKRVYRNSPVTGSGSYLRVDDTASLTNARNAFVRAFTSMTDVDTGTGATPNATDRPNGVLWGKSDVLSTTGKRWIAIATEKWFYLFVDVLSSSLAQYVNTPYFAGDIESRIPGDSGCFMVSWTRVTTFTGSGTIQSMALHYGWSGLNDQTAAYACGSLITGSAGAAARLCGLVGSWYNGAVVTPPGNVGAPYPDAVGGGLITYRPMIMDGMHRIRGFYPNLYAPFHAMAFSDRSTHTDIDGLPGVTLLALTVPEVNGSTGGWGNVMIDVTTEAAL